MASFGPLQSSVGVASSNFDFTHLSIHATGNLNLNVWNITISVAFFIIKSWICIIVLPSDKTMCMGDGQLSHVFFPPDTLLVKRAFFPTDTLLELKRTRYRDHPWEQHNLRAIDDRRISLKAIDERAFSKFCDKKWRIYKFAQQKCRFHTFLCQKSLVP